MELDCYKDGYREQDFKFLRVLGRGKHLGVTLCVHGRRKQLNFFFFFLPKCFYIGCYTGRQEVLTQPCTWFYFKMEIYLYLCTSLFAFSYCSWGSEGKNAEVVCHPLLQWTTFCQNSPPRPTHLEWPYTACLQGMAVPWTSRTSNQSILKKIKPEYSLGGLMLMLQYFGHLMQRADSLEKTPILGKTEGRRKRGWQRTRWFDGITDSTDMRLSKLKLKMVKTGKPGMLSSMESQTVRHNWATEQQQIHQSHLDPEPNNQTNSSTGMKNRINTKVVLSNGPVFTFPVESRKPISPESTLSSNLYSAVHRSK